MKDNLKEYVEKKGKGKRKISKLEKYKLEIFDLRVIYNYSYRQIKEYLFDTKRMRISSRGICKYYNKLLKETEKIPAPTFDPKYIKPKNENEIKITQPQKKLNKEPMKEITKKETNNQKKPTQNPNTEKNQEKRNKSRRVYVTHNKPKPITNNASPNSATASTAFSHKTPPMNNPPP